MKYNRENSQQVYGTKLCKDKIHNKLNNNNTKDEILKGKLKREECNDEDNLNY